MKRVTTMARIGSTLAAAGASGLPESFKAPRPVPLAPGSLAGHRTAVQARAAMAQAAVAGYVVTPGTPLREAIARVCGGKANAPGGRLLFAEGRYDFGEGETGVPLVTITNPGLEFVALSPGRTVFSRASSASTSTWFRVEAERVRFDGITFDDASGTNPTIAFVAGSNFGVVERCEFARCGYAITGVARGTDDSYSPQFVSIRDNIVYQTRAPQLTFGAYQVNPVIYVEGRHWHITGNRIVPAGDWPVAGGPATPGIVGAAGLELSTFVGNVVYAASTLSGDGRVVYPAGAGNVDAGNIASLVGAF